jgi:hypothetical protein
VKEKAMISEMTKTTNTARTQTCSSLLDGCSRWHVACLPFPVFFLFGGLLGGMLFRLVRLCPLSHVSLRFVDTASVLFTVLFPASLHEKFVVLSEKFLCVSQMFSF